MTQKMILLAYLWLLTGKISRLKHIYQIHFMIIALTNAQQVSTETKYPRTKTNFFNPILSANIYNGHIKENERIVQVQPRLYATDADSPNTLNGRLFACLSFICNHIVNFVVIFTGKICGYELSLYKHEDLLSAITADIPFTVELVNNEAVLKLKSDQNTLDCEIKQIYRLFIRAYDCASNENRRYSERYVVEGSRETNFLFFFLPA